MRIPKDKPSEDLEEPEQASFDNMLDVGDLQCIYPRLGMVSFRDKWEGRGGDTSTWLKRTEIPTTTLARASIEHPMAIVPNMAKAWNRWQYSTPWATVGQLQSGEMAEVCRCPRDAKTAPE